MKHKLLSILVTLTLALGFCAPQDECTKLHQNPAICRGFEGPVAKINNQPRILR